MGPVAASRVEAYYTAESGFQVLYPPDEKIRTVVVDSFPELGRLTALRFLEWVQARPGGAVSLPTGKTPEHFIAWVRRYLAGWTDPRIQKELLQRGLNPAVTPDMRGIRFVQMDEFFPLDSRRHNSFCNYVRRFYIDGFGLDPAKALLIDCNGIGLSSAPEEVQAWCDRYEQRIRDLGGIGFFLGGIGPDGHIAFNIRGSAHDSATRLLATNYETQAAAATDLGGIDVARKMPVITIGLGTITANPDCVAVIMAAGAAKAGIVADAIQRPPSPEYPATALRKLPNAVFYLTRGAAERLGRHALANLERQPQCSRADAVRIVVDLSARLERTVDRLTDTDFRADPFGNLLLRRLTDVPHLRHSTVRALESALDRGLAPCGNARFLHTEPHHDDIMLGYLPAVIHHLRDTTTTHSFATFTSGFTAVTNDLFLGRARDALAVDDRDADPSPGPREALALFVHAHARGDAPACRTAAARRFRSDVAAALQTEGPHDAAATLRRIIDAVAASYPGQKDPPEIQRLKGMIREWEAETLWAILGVPRERVHHLRLGFYQGDIFTEEPTESRDVAPIINLIADCRPDILTVALDPEASGPDTHYKVLQAAAAAVRHCRDNGLPCPSRIWGYRNVWHRFHASEANMMFPVSEAELDRMERLFMDTFLSQRDASFPSYEYDGPFSGLARRIQTSQLQGIQACLGPERFASHRDPRARNAAGLIFLRELDVPEFLAQCRELRRATEATTGNCKP